MKYVASLVAGILVGSVLFLLLLYHNPFSDTHNVSPLAVSDVPLVAISYSAVPSEAIAWVDNGETRIEPRPSGIADLWEPTIARTRILVTEFTDKGAPVGIGVKFSSDSESTRLLYAQALVDSAWHIYLPDSGSLFIGQRENLWPYLRNIVLPARWNSADSWRGTWFGITTSGPRALGTGTVAGGSGRYSGVTSEAVEALSARAYSAAQGPVAMTGTLTVAVPEANAHQESAR
jgi:hypothetical protein